MFVLFLKQICKNILFVFFFCETIVQVVELVKTFNKERMESAFSSIAVLLSVQPSFVKIKKSLTLVQTVSSQPFCLFGYLIEKVPQTDVSTKKWFIDKVVGWWFIFAIFALNLRLHLKTSMLNALKEWHFNYFVLKKWKI